MSRHRVIAASPLTLAALGAALAGAIGLSTAGTAAAAPAPAPAFTLPDGVQLPEQLDNALGDLLPPGILRARAVKPANGTVTSSFGARWGTHHNGVDIANRIGTPVRAVTDGVVIEAGPASGYGLWIRVRQDDGTTGIFGHVDQILVRTGQKLRAGQQIGTMGNRGNSTGPHLHYEVWNTDRTPINPVAWLNKRGVRL